VRKHQGSDGRNRLPRYTNRGVGGGGCSKCLGIAQGGGGGGAPDRAAKNSRGRWQTPFVSTRSTRPTARRGGPVVLGDLLFRLGAWAGTGLCLGSTYCRNRFAKEGKS